MKSRLFFLVMVLSLFFISAYVSSAEIKGYISDSLCGQAGFPEGYNGKIDLTTNPENHAVACLTMDNCAATGYGIFIVQKDGKYKYFKFDKKSSDLIKKQVLGKIKDKLAKTPLVVLDAEVKNDIYFINKIISFKVPEASDKKDKNDMSGMDKM
jgi:hypothetical protein